MAKLSNINGKFAVEDTGAIRFSDQTGTTGQILKSNGNSAPTWVDPNTVGTGPWLPLAGGVVSGPTTFQSSLTVGGLLTGANATFNGLMKLDAGGILQFAANTATPSMGVAIHRSAADTLNFVTASTNRLTINGSGNVGVGIDTPTLVAGKIVHIHGVAAGVHLTDTASGTTSGDGGYVAFDNPNLYIQNKEAGSMFFETSGTTALTINSSGNTTFAGTGTFTTATNRILTLDSTTTSGGYTLMSFKQLGTEQFRIFGNHTENYLSFYNDQGTGHQLTLASDGNVGIGATNPFAKLEVTGNLSNNWAGRFENTNSIGYGILAKINSTDSSDYIFQARTGSTNVMTILGDGNIGIGTATPSSKLHVYSGTAHGEIRLTTSTAAGYDAILSLIAGTSGGISILNLGYNGDDDYSRIFRTGSGDLRFDTNNAERMRIDSSGNTTITTTSNQGGLTVTSATDNTVLGINNTATGGQNWRLQSIGGGSGSGQGKLLIKVGGGETAANLISFVTDGSGANIKMGIGTTSPAEKLHIVGDGDRIEISSADYDLVKIGAFGTGGADIDNGFFNLLTNGSEKIRLLANGTSYFNGGNVGIGTTSPGQLLHLNSGSTVTTTDANNMLLLTRNNHSYILFSCPDEKDSGIHFHNTTDNSFVGRIAYSHEAAGDKLFFRVGGNEVFTLFSNGNATLTGTLTQNSDITLKENIKPLQSQLKIVSKLNPVSYNKIGQKENEVGFIAQEVEKLLPELVCEDKDGLKSLAYGNMNAILVKAIQELEARIKILENK